MLSDSATAGVGVGSGVAGLAIGATVCFLYFTRWKRDRDHGHKHREQTTPDNELNKLQLLSQMLDTASPTLWEECITLYKNNLATHLPQHMYAGRIKEEIGNIYHKLLRYENDFIVPQTPRPRLDRAAMLKLIGPRHVDQLLELVQNEDQGNAKKALVIIFNMAIMSRLDFNGDPDATLLPPDVLRFYQGLLQSAEANGEAHGRSTRTEKLLLFRDCWRNLTCNIYIDRKDFTDARQIEIPEEDVRRERARDLSAAITELMLPFLRDGKFSGISTALESSILSTAAKAFALFSQVDTISGGWEDLWAVDEKDGQRKLLLFPAYYQHARKRQPITGQLLGGSQVIQRSKAIFDTRFEDDLVPMWKVALQEDYLKLLELQKQSQQPQGGGSSSHP